MQCARWLLGLVLAGVAGCSDLPATGAAPPGEESTLERIADEVRLRKVEAGEVILEVHLARLANSLDVLITGADMTAAELHIAIPDLPELPPAGDVRAGAVHLSLAPHRDGRTWNATFGARNFALDDAGSRAELADALAASELGASLLRLLPFHDAVRARLAESLPLFRVAALATAGAGDRPDAWPVERSQDDLTPPGMRVGDRPGLGMTCATHIRCPGGAPTCVTEDHAHDYGFCSRACWSDADCGAGLCAIEVGDIPAVPGTVTMCVLPCRGDADCPALLTCSGRFGWPTARYCAPPPG